MDTGTAGDRTDDTYYNSGDGWDPIGLFDTTVADRRPYSATFDGNGHTISNLFINRTTGGDDNQGFGLFAYLDSNSEVRRVGLLNVNVTGRQNTGSLIGRGEGRVYASYATGSVTGTGTVGGLVAHTRSTAVVAASWSAVSVTATSNLGGLVGLNAGDIIATYATGAVRCNDGTNDCTGVRGGLVGSHRDSTGSVVASYATGTVTPTGTGAGGLIGNTQGSPTITNSYWDSTTTSITTGSNGSPQTTSALQTPTAYGTGTAIYAAWNVDVDGDTTTPNDDPWDFGTDYNYPALKADFNGDGTATWQEFGNQRVEAGVSVLDSASGSAVRSYTTVEVPTDSADAAAQAAQNATPPSNTRFTAGGPVYDIRVHSSAGDDITSRLPTPVQVCLPIPADVDQSQAHLYRYNTGTGQWERQAAGRVTRPSAGGGQEVCADVAQFSFFRVGTFTQPTQPEQPSGGGNGGGGGGGGGGGSRDLHGNTPAQATSVPLGKDTSWTSSTDGQINTARDIDYFTLDIPHAGVLVVETTGRTDTVGTVWQDDVELATAVLGGARRNFRLHTPVQAGPVVIAVEGNGTRTGSYTLQTTLLVGYLENPGAESLQSGIGVLSGWVCEADTVEIEINGEPQPTAYGTERSDTADICGHPDTGFGLLFNWNHLGDGDHEVIALVDGGRIGQSDRDRDHPGW